MEQTGQIREQSLAERAVKTLIYCPFEDDHADESPMIAALLLGCCLALGVVASFDNIVWGVALSAGCLYGAAAVRYAVHLLG